MLLAFSPPVLLRQGSYLLRTAVASVRRRDHPPDWREPPSPNPAICAVEISSIHTEARRVAIYEYDGLMTQLTIHLLPNIIIALRRITPCTISYHAHSRFIQADARSE